jgi:hypothetical protein
VSFLDEVRFSIDVAERNLDVIHAHVDELSSVIADRNWEEAEAIRFKMHAALDGYLDNLLAAGRRVERERDERRGRT